MQLLSNFHGMYEIWPVDHSDFDEQVKVITELAYYSMAGGKDGEIAVPVLVIDEDDDCLTAETYILNEAIEKLRRMTEGRLVNVN